MECAPCPACDDISEFNCLNPCRHTVTVTPSDGTADVVATDAAVGPLSYRTVATTAFRSTDTKWKIHKSVYSDTASPPRTITDPDGNVWTVVSANYSTQWCYWSCICRSLKVEQNWGSIEIGTMVTSKDANGFVIHTVTWSDAPGSIVADGGFRSYDDTQQHALDQVEVSLDPASFPLGTNWTLLRFRESATGPSYRYESRNQPELGEPLVIQAEEVRDGT